MDLAPEAEGTPVADLVVKASDAYASTQAELAKQVGMKPLALTQWRGAKRTPSAATIRKMAKELLRKSDELRLWSLKLEELAAKEAKGRRRDKKKRRQAAAPQEKLRPRAAPAAADNDEGDLSGS